MIIATLVTVVDMVMNAYTPDLYKVLGLFIPLIVVNCIVLGRAESFASKNGVIDSILDGIGSGIGFTFIFNFLRCSKRNFRKWFSIWNLISSC